MTTPPNSPIEWLEQIKGYLQRCKDTEWDENDERNYLVAKAALADWGKPMEALSPTARKQGHAALFAYLGDYKPPAVVSEMNDLIFIVHKYFEKIEAARLP